MGEARITAAGKAMASKATESKATAGGAAAGKATEGNAMAGKEGMDRFAWKSNVYAYRANI